MCDGNEVETDGTVISEWPPPSHFHGMSVKYRDSVSRSSFMSSFHLYPLQ